MASKSCCRSKYDSCVYHGDVNLGEVAYLLLYVDDMLIASKNSDDIKRLKNLLKGEFEIKNLGNAKRILNMDIYRDRVVGTLFLSQDRYVNKVLNMFGSSV